MTYGHTSANPLDLSDLNESHSTKYPGFSLQKAGNRFEYSLHKYLCIYKDIKIFSTHKWAVPRKCDI